MRQAVADVRRGSAGLGTMRAMAGCGSAGLGTMRAMAGGIVRVWKGYGTAGGVRRYCEEHFAHAILPQLRALDGFVKASLLVRSRESDSESEVVVATQWESLTAIRQFAGDDYERAVVEPVVRDLLDHFEDRVTHYTIEAEFSSRGGGNL